MTTQGPRPLTTTHAGRRAVVLVLGVALALLLGGCGGSTKGDSPAAAKPRTSPGASPAPTPQPGYQAPRVGQCGRLTNAESLASVAANRKVGCRMQHTSVVAYVGYVPKAVSATTPLVERRALGRRLCQPAYVRLAGGTVADRATSLLTWTLFTPTQAQLARGARWVRCDVLARSGAQLVPLPAGKPILAHGVPEALRICQTANGADVSCARPHAFRVAAVFQAVGNGYPDPKRYTAIARDRCASLMKGYGGYWQPPSRSGWAAGDRFIRCLSAALTQR